LAFSTAAFSVSTGGFPVRFRRLSGVGRGADLRNRCIEQVSGAYCFPSTFCGAYAPRIFSSSQHNRSNIGVRSADWDIRYGSILRQFRRRRSKVGETCVSATLHANRHMNSGGTADDG
jgi:hypothetical protein